MQVEDVKGATQTALAAGATGGTANLPKDRTLRRKPSCSDPVGTRRIYRQVGKCDLALCRVDSY